MHICDLIRRIQYFVQYFFENNITKSKWIHAKLLYQRQQKREPIVEQKSRWSWLTRSNGGIVSIGPRWARIDHVCHRAGHADRDQGWSLLPTTPNYSTPHSCSTPNTRQCSPRLYSNQVDSSPTLPLYLLLNLAFSIWLLLPRSGINVVMICFEWGAT